MRVCVFVLTATDKDAAEEMSLGTPKPPWAASRRSQENSSAVTRRASTTWPVLWRTKVSTRSTPPFCIIFLPSLLLLSSNNFVTTQLHNFSHAYAHYSTLICTRSLSLVRSLAPALPLRLHRPRELVAAAGLANPGRQTRVDKPGSGSIKGPTLLPQLAHCRTSVGRLLSIYPVINPVINNLGATITHAQHKMHFAYLFLSYWNSRKLDFNFSLR